ncbi:lytic transglycosylase [Neisseria animalis]|uniref:LysM peptidoglycan-binding domain-containing protein n=1 Tax=Neisseria animalis TaxID=492 RepID=A0A5P3MP76_NEIAN|nr:LysM peptidoglycan-binding domain-containing protein [Neisseria animalis]QEY23333.1 LysM peptidoglycan-binding domain-containing protein [Neisseria animalis]ROW33182.1 LysM peptidoglycan-binding domain-containing protein [Neisseria animalis]VEE08702.1 murein transglycosylase/nitrite reductase transcriptional regulator [Neisseria animalis]
MAKFKTIALTLSGLSVFSVAHIQAAPASPNQVGMAMMRLNASLFDQAKAQTFGSGSLWASLSKNFRMHEVNPEIVRRHENRFVSGSAYFDRTINRGKPYMHHIATEVKKRNMPAEIALLPFIESAFVTKAKSHVGASGLWQFMPATGRQYGLERTALYDGRHDVYAATDAALNYLEYLHGLFGDWSLALAAYNWGEGNVGRAINRARAQGLEPTYENLRMPNETRNYVPKLLAVRNIVANPQSFGINVSEIKDRPYFKALTLDKPIDQSAITRLAGISESEFLALNPAFNAPVFIPKANRKLLLPASAVDTFEKNYRNADPDSLLSWDIYTPYSKTSLSSIAAETGMSIAEIKRLNGISSNTLSAGRSILVAKNTAGSKPAASNIDFISNTSDFAPEISTLAAAPLENTPNSGAAIATLIKPDNLPSVTPDIIDLTRPSETAAQTDSFPQESPYSEQTPKQIATLLPQPTPLDAAISEPLPLPTQGRLQNDEAADSLMQLADGQIMQHNAAEAVREAIEQADAREAAARARAETRARQQRRSEARLARARTATVPNGMHRVAEGDTLFNIAQRYNLSVADLIVTNNIKGNNIRTGQILNVAAAPAQAVSNTRNVSYTVRKGDTLNTIANRFNVEVNDIRRWNKNTRTVSPGQRLKLMGS